MTSSPPSIEQPATDEPDIRTLLIIDDTINNLRVAVDLLHAYGFRVLTASSGEDGIERAILAQPDLVLLDVGMPGLDGFETCRRLKAHPQTGHIPVVFMTAMTDTDNKVRGFDLGAVDYVTKPFDAGELLARVRTHLELNELRQGLEARVAKRTQALAEEVSQRKHGQAEQAKLLDLVRQQSEQLRTLTSRSLGQEAEAEQILHHRLVPMIDAIQIGINQIAEQLSHLHECADLPATETLQRQVGHVQGMVASAMAELQQAEESESGMGRHSLLEDPMLQLTTREYEVLQLIGQGKSNTEIAEILTVSRSTVSSYRSRIMNKLDIPDAASLMRYLIEWQMGG